MVENKGRWLSFFSTCLLVLIFSSFAYDAQAQVRFRDVVIPPSLEQPAGMIETVAEDDSYAAKYLPDIIYATYGERAVTLSLLMPKQESAKSSWPLIVYVQGAAWRNQNLYQALPQLADFAHQGYIVASIEHRPSSEAIAPAQVQDIKSAIRYLRKNAEKYNIDPNRIGIMGDSSGGHLAVMVGVSEGEADFETGDNQPFSSTVKAVVDLYGPTDFLQMHKYPSRIDHNAEDSPESLVVGGPIQDPKYRALVDLYNPLTYIEKDKKLPPFFIIHGDKDALVPFNQSVLLYTKLRDTNHEVAFYKIKGAGHGPGIWTKGVMDRIQEFFDHQLK
ncbi:MAG: alpha/beta hydrolase [Thalassolituus sp.]|uniref:alpha/beta hydrolase fold domain-containing protein n=1 Tax=Thalassolituus sp. TaxID=2030822 RepID=UPI0039820CE1